MNDSVRCLLWDFGDTLVDERFLSEESGELAGFAELWGALEVRGVHDAWYRGELSMDEVARLVGGELGSDPEAVVAHVRRACRNIRAFDRTFAFARSKPLPQAIVTVNPDLFDTDIVPALELERWFDPIVSSWKERTLDKAELCDVALARMSGGFERSQALLIDNKEINVEDWRRRGGRGYVYRDDATFAADLASGRLLA